VATHYLRQFTRFAGIFISIGVESYRFHTRIFHCRARIFGGSARNFSFGFPRRRNQNRRWRFVYLRHLQHRLFSRPRAARFYCRTKIAPPELYGAHRLCKLSLLYCPLAIQKTKSESKLKYFP